MVAGSCGSMASVRALPPNGPIDVHRLGAAQSSGAAATASRPMRFAMLLPFIPPRDSIFLRPARLEMAQWLTFSLRYCSDGHNRTIIALTQTACTLIVHSHPGAE